MSRLWLRVKIMGVVTKAFTVPGTMCNNCKETG